MRSSGATKSRRTKAVFVDLLLSKQGLSSLLCPTLRPLLKVQFVEKWNDIGVNGVEKTFFVHDG